MSTLLDLGAPRKRLYGHQNYSPPQYAYFRACLKKLWGPSPKICPPPGKIPAGAHVNKYNMLIYYNYYEIIERKQLAL